MPEHLDTQNSSDNIQSEIVDIYRLANIPFVVDQQEMMADKRKQNHSFCVKRCAQAADILKQQGHTIPQHVLQFLSAAKGVRQRITDILMPNLFRAVTYLAAETGMSIHYLVYGEQLPIELFGRTASYLRIIEKLDDNQRTEIINTLKNDPMTGSNFLVTFKERCYEAGFAQDLTRRTISYFRRGGDAMQEMLDYLFEEELPNDIEEIHDTPLNKKFCYDLMLIRFCVLFRLSADYLLRRDYSPYAQLDGEPLTDRQRQWLSAYLCATTKAQFKVICKMAYWLVDRKDLR